MMQTLALVAMEPPIGFEADYIRNEKLKVYNTVRLMDDEYIDKYTVRGQYGPGRENGKEVPGYRKENNVAPDSNSPTFFCREALYRQLALGRGTVLSQDREAPEETYYRDKHSFQAAPAKVIQLIL